MINVQPTKNKWYNTRDPANSVKKSRKSCLGLLERKAAPATIPATLKAITGLKASVISTILLPERLAIHTIERVEVLFVFLSY